jgi:hypothetical protein
MVNYEGPQKRSRGDKRAQEYIEARQRRMYRHQLDGHSVRQIVYEHSAREGISIPTAWRDWDQVKSWTEADWIRDREAMLGRIQTMRLRVVHAAMKKGHYQVAAQVLDSLGRVLGENTPEQVSIQVPSLSIQVEPQVVTAQLPQSDVIEAEITPQKEVDKVETSEVE